MPKTARDSFKFMLRLPDELREALKRASEESGRSVTAEIIHRLEQTFAGEQAIIPTTLMQRIRTFASRHNRSANEEIVGLLEREYPAPSDVMYIHLDNIRRVLDKYERAKDPRERLYLQSLVEAMVTSGHNFSIDWEDEVETPPSRVDATVEALKAINVVAKNVDVAALAKQLSEGNINGALKVMNLNPADYEAVERAISGAFQANEKVREESN